MKKLVLKIVLFIISIFIVSNFIFASELKMKLGDTYSVGHDKGYSATNKKEIGRNDVHYGWELSEFYISGYSNNERITEDGIPVFLKNLNDKVTLSFVLKQDINTLNGNENLTINEDVNGQDVEFGTEKINMGKGMLLIRHTNYQNVKQEPVKYENYLVGKIKGADIEVHPLEEGDYEVALDYEIKHTPRKVLGHEIIPEYHDYRTTFKFKIRNGNCMVFPLDVKTNGELPNSMVTENGFKLDLAKSRYLAINIKREVLREGGDGLTEDIRFNRTAKDGDEYTEEGIYTITVKNPYTNQETVKKIYVGKDANLNNYIPTELNKVAHENVKPKDEIQEPQNQLSNEDKNPKKSNHLIIIVLVILGIVVILVISILKKNYKEIKKEIKKEIEQKESENTNEEENDDEVTK